MRNRFRRLRGWSLIELTIILIVLAILCAILAPVIGRFVVHAKIIRVREDCQAIGCTIWMFIHDTGGLFFRDASPNPALGAGRGDSPWAPGSAPYQYQWNIVNLLVGDGDIPHVGPTGDATWTLPVDFDAVDFMEYHLCTNRPGNDPANAYRTPLDLDKGGNAYPADPMFAHRSSGGFNAEFSWRGPYITPPIDPDPWGNRYACNVVYLDPISNSRPQDCAIQGLGGWTFDCVVISAGPDEEIDSDYEADGLVGRDDDYIYTVSGGSLE